MRAFRELVEASALQQKTDDFNSDSFSAANRPFILNQKKASSSIWNLTMKGTISEELELLRVHWASAILDLEPNDVKTEGA